MTYAEYPEECEAYLNSKTQTEEAAALARKGVTATRLASRIVVGVRLVRAFYKAMAQRRHAEYLKRSTLCDLCGDGSLANVEQRISERPWEIGQADALGLYPAHHAAMNEEEDGPLILEAILKANRFAARQRDRFGALPLHYACRNRGPTARQDTLLRLHASKEPCVHRLVSFLLNASHGFAGACKVADVDGYLPMDYLLGNPNSRNDSNSRALRMLLWVCPESANVTVNPGELDGRLDAKLRTSKQCPGYIWWRIADTYGAPIKRAATQALTRMPTGFWHNNHNEPSFGVNKAQQLTSICRQQMIRQDLASSGPQSQYLRIFFSEWCLVPRNRLRPVQRSDTESAVREDKQRAFGRAAAAIAELNLVIESLHDWLQKEQKKDKGGSARVRRWLVSNCSKDDHSKFLHHALHLEDDTWTPLQKLRRMIDDLAKRLVEGRPGLYFNFPHDAMCAIERCQLHSFPGFSLPPVPPFPPLHQHQHSQARTVQMLLQWYRKLHLFGNMCFQIFYLTWVCSPHSGFSQTSLAPCCTE
jgi:hypothetical protein